ncbi:MAG: hypothetical protein SchgKO_06560 [Schleiferiaceae bacterium]
MFFLARSTPKQYQSETEIYTGFATGLNLDNVERATLDFFAINTAFDNLMNVIRSRETLQEVGDKMFYNHFSSDSTVFLSVKEEIQEQVRKMIPEELLVQIKGKSEAEALEIIRNFRMSYKEDEQVKLLFYDSGSPYSSKAIEKVDIERLNNSDFIKLRYKWYDPYITQQTLVLLNEVFMKKIASIKKGQANNVVEYFRRQTALAYERLQKAEENLKEYRIDNRIINYGEQTKSLATMKEFLEDEYQKELAAYEAAKATVEKLEKQLELNSEIIKLSDEILAKRQELSEINTRLSLLQIYYQDEALKESLEEQAVNLKAEISRLMRSQYAHQKTTDGVPIKEVLNEWLEATLTLDQNKARLKVFEQRKEYFARSYDAFAPLGSNLAKMEREIGVEEKNYLELLHSLNLALMRLEGEALSSGGLVITGIPSFPLSPLPSKTKVLVAVGGIVGFMFPMIITLLLFFFDRSLRDIPRTESKTGLKVIAAFPDLKKLEKIKGVNLQKAETKSRGILVQKTLVETGLIAKGEKPFLITIFGTHSGAGKAFIADEIARELLNNGYSVAVAHPQKSEEELAKKKESEETPVEKPYTEYHYDPNHHILGTYSAMDLVGKPSETHDFMILIIPSIQSDRYPIEVVRSSDLFFLIAGANETWRRTDRNALTDFRQLTTMKPFAILNKVDLDEIEDYLGEIKVRKSILKRTVRRYLKS